MFGDVTTIMANVGECGLEGSIQDLYDFCVTHDCSGTTLATNLGNNIFALFEIGNNVASVALKFPSKKSDDLGRGRVRGASNATWMPPGTLQEDTWRMSDKAVGVA